MAAIIILSIIWGTIGWCIAKDHLHMQDSLSKAMVSLVFILVVICIERFIILTVGGLGMAKTFRIALALLMAALGSTIFDQIIFRQDVEVKMKEVRTAQINGEVPKRLSLIEADISEISIRVDSLNKISNEIYEEVSKKPLIAAFDVVQEEYDDFDAEGNPIIKTKQTISKKNVQNPLIGKVRTMEEEAHKSQERLRELQMKRLSIEDDVRKEYEQARIGFLEELTALYSILLATPVALGFYIFLFLFLSFLEMLVVTTKSSSKCDYELIIEHQLKVKEELLTGTKLRLTKA